MLQDRRLNQDDEKDMDGNTASPLYEKQRGRDSNFQKPYLDYATQA